MDRLLIALGAGLGLAITMVITGMSHQLVDLPALAARLDPRGAPTAPAGSVLVRWAARLDRGRTPAADLELIGETRQHYLTVRGGFALTGALLPPALLTLLTLAGLGIPIVATTATSLLGAAIGWQIPPLLVRSQAQTARLTFRRALCSYFELVALERAADRGPVEALEHPSGIGRGWAFARIHTEFDRARRKGLPPWTALQRLADQIGIDELADLSSILTLSEEEGASIVESLAAKAASMRQRLLAEEMAAAHERNRLLDLPLSMLGMTIVLFLLFPGLYLLVTT